MYWWDTGTLWGITEGAHQKEAKECRDGVKDMDVFRDV